MLGFIADRLRRFVLHLRLLPAALALVWRAAPLWSCLWAALLLLQGLLPLVTVYLSRSLVDGLVAAARAGGAWQSARGPLLAAGLIAAAALLAELLRAAGGWVRTQATELVQDHISDLVHRKSAEVDLAFYDSADFFDRLHRARAEAGYRPVALLESLGGGLQNAVTLAAMLVVLTSFGWWVPAALAGGTAPALFVVLRHAVRQHQLRVRTTADERRTWYYDWLLTARESAAEVRLFGLGGHFRAVYQEIRTRLRGENGRLARGNALAQLGAGVLGLGITGGCLAWMLLRSLRGAATLGELALFYQAFQQGLRIAQALLDNVGQTYYNSLFLGNLLEFLELRPAVNGPAVPVPAPARVARAIAFRGVGFRYSGSERPALSGFDLEIPAGKITAVVGPNGAGKSTLIKLLCRLYDPQQGRIEIDGIDLRNFSPEQLRSRVSVLFQEPVRYNTTAGENIRLGDIPAAADTRRVREAAEGAGADSVIAELPRSYSSVLGRYFLDGEELSAGQWQRIALARAFYRQAPILILDEPTSAMDPWAEADWFDRFRALARGRTSLLITHRFTTAMRADIIHVLADGRIAESGTHAQLLAARGLYAGSWHRQMQTREEEDAFQRA